MSVKILLLPIIASLGLLACEMKEPKPVSIDGTTQETIERTEPMT